MFHEAGVCARTISLSFLICSSARSLLSRFGEIAPDGDFISNSLFLKRLAPPVCELVTGYVSHIFGSKVTVKVWWPGRAESGFSSLDAELIC